MIALRNFTDEDAVILQRHQYRNASLEEVQKIIREWNQKEYHGKYFEMFAIMSKATVVGTISLHEKSKNVVSCGLEVFADHRRQGFGKEAKTLALEMAKRKGYKIAMEQIRADNTASIALHRALDFETDDYIYTNRKGNEVLIYLKALIQ